MKKLIILIIMLSGLSIYSQNINNNGIIDIFKSNEQFKPLSTLYQWDTIITFDTSGNISRRFTQQYNGECRVAKQLVEKINSDSITWRNESQHVFTYSSNCNLTSDLEQRWTDSTNWYNYGKWVYTYNANNKIETEIYNYWQDTTMKYSIKYDNIYYNSGLLKERITSRYFNNAGILWLPDWKYTYLTYTGEGNTSTQLLERYKYNNGSYYWENFCFYDYSYIQSPMQEVNNQIIMKDWIGGTWVNGDKFDYTFDSNFNCIDNLYQNWIDNKWVNNQGGYAYFSNNNRLVYTHRVWNDSTWVDDMRLVTAYDNNHNSIEQIHYRQFNGSWVPSSKWATLMVSMFNNASIYRDWYYISASGDAGYHAFFKLFNVGIGEPQNENIKIHPNPTNDYVYFDKIYKNVKLYSAYGNKLHELKNIQKLDLSNYKSGMYILEIDNKETKIIKL